MNDSTHRDNDRHQRRWPMAKRVERQARRLEQMIEAIGLDAAAAARLDRGVGFAQARRLCLTCDHTRGCQAWLESNAGGSAPKFCENRPYFDLVFATLRDFKIQ